MKQELVSVFGMSGDAVSVIPYGYNNAVPETALTTAEARLQLGLGGSDRVVLFFGAIAPYKGLDVLVEAFRRLVSKNPAYRLVVAGQPKGGCGGYLQGVQRAVAEQCAPGQVLQKVGYIPDCEMEVYFKAADVLVLPYRAIYQSGILFLAYRFGLPVVASDVGSFGEDIRNAGAGLVCQPENPEALKESIEQYFRSDLFLSLDATRRRIREYARTQHSWERAGRMTAEVYQRMVEACR
jgi:glycosyltransferase involved in cell wall biosynthesis